MTSTGAPPAPGCAVATVCGAWLLGEEVYNNSVKEASGQAVYKPSWSTLISYEFQVRKKAMMILNCDQVS